MTIEVPSVGRQMTFGHDIDIDPLWCSWFSGLIDGEGSFNIHVNKENRSIQAHLRIGMREDEAEYIRDIHDMLRCGWIGRATLRNPRGNESDAYFIDFASDAVINIIIPLLDKYPLRMKKKRDYVFWREATLIIHDDGHLNGRREEVLELKRKMEKGRRYRSPKLCQ